MTTGRDDDDERHPTLRGPRAMLRHRPLRQLVLTRMLGALGDGAFQGALAGAVLFSPERQSDALAIAGGFAVLLLPYSVIGPFAGALLDRWSRRQVLVWANLLRAVLTAGVAGLIALNAPNVILFVGALFVTGTSRFVGSGLSAAIPHTVPADSLTGANSLSTTVGSIFTLIGAGVAFGLRALIGHTHLPLAAVTCSVIVFYVLGAWASAQFDRAALGPDDTDEDAAPLLAVLHGLGAGVAHVVQRPTVGMAVSIVILVRFCFGLATLEVLLLFQHHFTGHGFFAGGVGGIGQVLGVAGLGLFLGAVSTAWFARRIGLRGYLITLLLVCAVVVLVAGSQFTEPMTMLTAFVLAFGYQSAKVCADTVVQHDSDDAHVGRVFAVYDTGNKVFYVAAFALGAVLVPPDGFSSSIPTLVGCVYLAAAAWYWWGMARIDRVAG